MIDIEKGIVELNGITITKDSTPEDFNKLPEGVVKYSTSKRFGGHFYDIIEPVCAGGVAMRACINFFPNKKIPKIELIPYSVETNHQAFEASHKWLEATLNTNVDASHYNMAVHSSKIKISCLVWYEPRDGLYDGGDIRIEFI